MDGGVSLVGLGAGRWKQQSKITAESLEVLQPVLSGPVIVREARAEVRMDFLQDSVTDVLVFPDGHFEGQRGNRLDANFEGYQAIQVNRLFLKLRDKAFQRLPENKLVAGLIEREPQRSAFGHEPVNPFEV